MIMIMNFLTLSRPAAFGDFYARTTEWHVALSTQSSGAKNGREL